MLAVSDFIDAAGLPVKWQERDLQMYLMKCLESRGFQVKDEVKINGGRADIVSNYLGNSIIEVKKFLDRDTIYQATGQLHLYGLGNARKLVIAGFITTDSSKHESALTTASMIQQDERYSVIFVNIDRDWYPGAETKFSFNNWKIRLPEFNFNWLKKPPTDKLAFSLLNFVYKVVASYPLPTFLIAMILYVVIAGGNGKHDISPKPQDMSHTTKKTGSISSSLCQRKNFDNNQNEVKYHFHKKN